jgi:hypothetical protein
LPGEEDKAADGARVSDEAIVSEDLLGQHNPAESEGPLDWKVRNDGLAKYQNCPNGLQRHELLTVAAYKLAGKECMWALHLSSWKDSEG